MTRSAFDCKHVKSVRAWALLHTDAPLASYGPSERPHTAGKVVADYSDCRTGSVCTVTVCVWAGPLDTMRAAVEAKRKTFEGMNGRAGGYGYCKFSAAFHDAVKKVDPEIKGVSSAGDTAVRAYLEGLGYTVIEVL